MTASAAFTRCAFVSVALLLSPPALADVGAPPVIGPDVTSFELANGLDVVVIPDHRAPVVTHMIWYQVGSADEPEGKTGIAHFLEHLMFKGTSTYPEGEFSRVVGEIGGEENAFTTADYTAYYQRVAKEKLELVMGYEADRMANLMLTDENVIPERKVILEERAMRVEAEPGAQLGNAVDSVLYLRHPYGVPVIGWREDMEKLSKEDAIAFYDRFYTPNNAVLVVAGDVTADEVRGLAEKTYGAVPRRAEPPARDRLDARILDIPREVSHADPKVMQESVRISWLAPSYRLAEGDQGHALDLLAETLGGGMTSILFRDLVIDQKLATSVGAYYNSSAWDMGSFTVYAAPRDGVTLEAMRAALMTSLDNAIRNRLTEEEIGRAKARLEADTIYAQDSQVALARIFGTELITGGTVEDVQSWPAHIRAVPIAAVREAAAFLAPERSVTGYLRKASPGERS